MQKTQKNVKNAKNAKKCKKCKICGGCEKKGKKSKNASFKIILCSDWLLLNSNFKICLSVFVNFNVSY